MPDGGPAVPPLLVIQPPAGENGPVSAGHLPYRRHTLAGRGPGRKFLNRRLLQASTEWAAGVRRLELQSQRSACSITDASGHQPRPRDRDYPGKVACRVGAHGVGAAGEVRDRSLPPKTLSFSGLSTWLGTWPESSLWAMTGVAVPKQKAVRKRRKSWQSSWPMGSNRLTAGLKDDKQY